MLHARLLCQHVVRQSSSFTLAMGFSPIDQRSQGLQHGLSRTGCTCGNADLPSHLQDLAKLGSWDRLEYYWTRAATESTQRKLHKLTRHAQDVLKRPVAAILAGAGAVMGFPDLKPQPDATVVIPDALPEAQEAVSAADAAKKKRRRAGVRPAKGAVAKVLDNSEAVGKPAAEPAKPAAQKAAADALQAAEQAAQRRALQVWLRQHPAQSCAPPRRLHELQPPLQHEKADDLAVGTLQGASAESASSFAQYSASLLSSPDATEITTPSAGSTQQVARRLSNILEAAMLGRHGDVALSAHEGEGAPQQVCAESQCKPHSVMFTLYIQCNRRQREHSARVHNAACFGASDLDACRRPRGQRGCRLRRGFRTGAA